MYNNGFYQPYGMQYGTYQNQYAQSPNSPQIGNTSQGGLNWCQGESGAKSYFVAPGSTALLMDSEESVFYIKSVDASGMPLPLRIFDYVERNANTSQNASNSPQIEKIDLDDKYVTRVEYNALIGKLEALRGNRKKNTPQAKKERERIERVEEEYDDAESFI